MRARTLSITLAAVLLPLLVGAAVYAISAGSFGADAAPVPLPTGQVNPQDKPAPESPWPAHSPEKREDHHGGGCSGNFCAGEDHGGHNRHGGGGPGGDDHGGNSGPGSGDSGSSGSSGSSGGSGDSGSSNSGPGSTSSGSGSSGSGSSGSGSSGSGGDD
jgi:hypothetical protein